MLKRLPRHVLSECMTVRSPDVIFKLSDWAKCEAEPGHKGSAWGKQNDD